VLLLALGAAGCFQLFCVFGRICIDVFHGTNHLKTQCGDLFKALRHAVLHKRNHNVCEHFHSFMVKTARSSYQFVPNPLLFHMLFFLSIHRHVGSMGQYTFMFTAQQNMKKYGADKLSLMVREIVSHS
jgi:hypothetical protein